MAQDTNDFALLGPATVYREEKPTHQCDNNRSINHEYEHGVGHLRAPQAVIFRLSLGRLTAFSTFAAAHLVD